MNKNMFELAARQDDILDPGLASAGEMHLAGLITIGIILATLVTGGLLTYAVLND